MTNRTKLIITAIVILISATVLYKIFFPGPDSLLEKLSWDIKELKEDVKDVDHEIADYYRRKNRKKPQFVFLQPGIIDYNNKALEYIKKQNEKYEKVEKPIKNQIEFNSEHEELIDLVEKKLSLQKLLADAYKTLANYYFNGDYLRDKNNPFKYKKDDHVPKNKNKIKAYNNKIKIKTLELALVNYNLATEATVDETSILFLINEKSNALSKNRLIIKNIIELNPLIQNLKKTSGFGEQYFALRVNEGIHHKKGKCYYQIARLTDLKAEYQKKYLDQAEKEYLISLGVNRHYSFALYDLAELYNYRYETFDDLHKTRYLGKAEVLLNTTMKVKKYKDKVTHRSIFGSRHTNALFLKARIYYNMGQLEEAQKIYKDNLMPNLPKGSSHYKNAEKNYTRIQDELDERRTN